MWATARLLPPAAASRLGAAVLRALGPLQRKHRQVLKNLHQALPDADPAALSRAARDVWGNLGAVLFEYPHLERIVDHRATVTMPPAVESLFDAGRPMLFLTGHLANWEVLASYIARRSAGLVVVYSPNDNPLIDRMIQRFRTRSGCDYVTKNEALRQLTARNLGGRSVGLLPDVRVDSAPSLPLFGLGAPTTISPARLATRLDYPMVPVRARRTGPARFEIAFEEPLTATHAGNVKQTATDLMIEFNRRLEGWIRERPGEWLCTKRRWPKDAAPG